MRTVDGIAAALTRCDRCAELWGRESRAGGWSLPLRRMPDQLVLLHPRCHRGHEPLEAVAGLGQLRPPRGPILCIGLVHDDGLGLWMSDVAVTVPVGVRRHRALVAGGVATERDHALLLGWTEAMERRCMLARPQAPTRKVSSPVVSDSASPLQWSIQARALATGERMMVLYERAVHSDVTRGRNLHIRTGSTGVAAYPSPEGARIRASQEILERQGLHHWWTTSGSRRCQHHTERMSEWLSLSTLAARPSRVDSWHLRYGRLHIAGCLITTSTSLGPMTVFGSGSGASVDVAVEGAFREALQLHVTRVLVEQDGGRAAFGRMYVGKIMPVDYLPSFRAEFPSASCSGDQEFHAPQMEVADAEIDCGDSLTARLGLSVVRVVPGAPAPVLNPRSMSASSCLRPDFLEV
ncbi:YcaO-like family protein [Streptomyces sp. NPDC059786]|uniref:YcaO-like family protein n=1 Tax=Streptomyces sp. NPDC059786 TaxID=3346946 RepID=UPI003657791A